MVEWHGTVVLTTRRLLVRTFRADDLAPYAALNADAEVMRYLGGPLPRQESDEIAEWANEHHEQDGLGLLAIERRDDGRFLGMCGLHMQDWYPEDVEIGWRLARQHWSRGYAGEAASAWLDHGFTVLGLPRVISITDVPNRRSVAVMHRLGMIFDHEADLPDEGTGAPFRAVIHSITADQWRTRMRRPECGCAGGSGAVGSDGRLRR